MAMQWKKEKIVDGVLQRDFELQVAGDTVPGVLWTPRDASGPRPLVCMGHGGSQHKKTPGIRSRAIEYAQQHGWASLAIDAPGHGDRVTREQAAAFAREVGERVTGRAGPTPIDSARIKAMFQRTGKAIAEWQAALDATLALDCVGESSPVAYWGVSMGTAIGIPFVAAEPRIQCAVFGLFGLRRDATEFAQAAQQIRIPVQFVFQWDDAVAPREQGIALFEALGSEDKAMHVHPGGHLDIPSYERHAWSAFFVRNLSELSERRAAPQLEAATGTDAQ
jgi:alpha-beta hydrolase superfamily lysophospholipase